jgi:hypothetical protein
MTKSIDKILASAKGKTGEMKAAKDDFKKLPSPWSKYEMNSNKVLRSIETKKIQQIPKAKSGYYLYIDNLTGSRRAVSEADLFKLVSFSKPEIKKSDKVKKESKPIGHGLSKEEVNALLDKNFVKKILQEGGAKHLICYKLDQEGCTTKEIMAITNSPYQSTKRNIWLYTSGKNKV